MFRFFAISFSLTQHIVLESEIYMKHVLNGPNKCA